MTPEQCQDLERGLDACSSRVRRLFEERSGGELTRRPAEDAWSAAECVVHLSLTAAASTPLIEGALADVRARGLVSRSPDRMDWLGFLLRWALEPPPRLRSRTAAPFRPQRVDPLDAVLPEFLAQQSRLVTALRGAEGLKLSARKVVSPFDSRIRYNVFAMFRILETHERRHLWQAEHAVSSSAPGGRASAE